MAQEISSSCTYTICEPGYALKKLLIETPATADTGDTIILTLADYGISDMMSIRSNAETTAGSVFADITNTTAISAGVLTITLGTASDKKVNIFVEGT